MLDLFMEPEMLGCWEYDIEGIGADSQLFSF